MINYSFLISQIEGYYEVLNEDRQLNIDDIDRILKIASSYKAGDFSTRQTLDVYQEPEISSEEKDDINRKLRDRLRRTKYSEDGKRVAAGDSSTISSVKEKIDQSLSTIREQVGAGTHAYQFANKIANIAKEDPDHLMAGHTLLLFAVSKIQDESLSDKTVYILKVASDIMSADNVAESVDYNDPAKKGEIVKLYISKYGLNRNIQSIRNFLDKELDLEDPSYIRRLSKEIAQGLRSETEQQVESLYQEWVATNQQSASELMNFLRSKGYTEKAVVHAVKSEFPNASSDQLTAKASLGSDMLNKKRVFSKAVEIIGKLDKFDQKILRDRLASYYQNMTSTGVSDGSS